MSRLTTEASPSSRNQHDELRVTRRRRQHRRAGALGQLNRRHADPTRPRMISAGEPGAESLFEHLLLLGRTSSPSRVPGSEML